MTKTSQARWREIGKNCLKLGRTAAALAKKNDLLSMAGSLSFTTVLSLAPLLAVAFYIFKIVGGLDYAYQQLLPYLLNILSEGTGEIVATHLNEFIRKVHASAVGWIGIAGLLVTWILTYLTVVKAFNRIWEVDRPRSIQRRLLRAVTVITVGPILGAASIVVTTTVATQVAKIPYSSQTIAILLSTILFTLLYALVPMVKVPYRILMFGSILPAVLLEVAKYVYAIYTKKMVTYSAFYGSFAVIPLFLLWIYIAWCITLFGAVWVRTLQKHRAQMGVLKGP